MCLSSSPFVAAPIMLLKTIMACELAWPLLPSALTWATRHKWRSYERMSILTSPFIPCRRLTFHSTSGQARHDTALEHQYQDHQWNSHNDGGSSQLSVGDEVLRVEARNTHGNWLRGLISGHGEAKEEVIPDCDER